MAKRFGKVRSYEEWRTPRLVGNALGLLEKEVSRKRAEISYVHLCFSTDPFMKDHPEVIELSLRIMEYLNRHRIRVATLTKGEYPREITENPSCHMNEYGISLVSLNEPFRHAYEPFTAPYEERIRGLERLHDAGLRTWACIEPYPPPNMVVQDIRDVLERIGFVDEIIFGKLNYNRIVQEYKHFKDFYRTCRDDVLAFCAERGIRTYVKAETDSL
jgi:DNA repair photolyase